MTVAINKIMERDKKHKQFIIKILAIFLLLFAAGLMFSAGAQNDKLYALILHYKKGPPETLSFKEINLTENAALKTDNQEKSGAKDKYALKTYSMRGEIQSLKFNPPVSDDTDFELVLPYLEKIAMFKVYDLTNNKVVLDEFLENFEQPKPKKSHIQRMEEAMKKETEEKAEKTRNILILVSVFILLLLATAIFFIKFRKFKKRS